MFKTMEELHAELREVENRRAALFAEHAQIQTRADGLDAPDPGLNERLARLNAGIEKLDARKASLEAEITRQTQGYDRIRDALDDPARLEAGDGTGGGIHRHDRPGNQARDVGLRTIERFVKSGELPAQSADRLEAVLRKADPAGHTARYLAAVGDDDYNSAFGKMVEDPTTGHLRFTPKEVAAVQKQDAVMRAIGTGSTGFPLPFTIDTSIIYSGAGALNPVRDIAHVVTVGTHDYKAVTSDGVTASYVQEATEATDASPTLAQPSISTQQGRAFVPFSIESGQDWASLQAELLNLITRGRDVLDATKFLTGSGTNEPAGVITGLTTTQRVQTGTTATYAVGDPWALKAAIPAAFIGNTTFAAASATWDTTFRFVGGNSTEPLQFDGGRGGDFLGRPKVEWSTMATGSTTGTKLIIGGDFKSGFTIVDRIGMSVELIPHLFGATNRFPTGQRGLYAYWRTGSAVVVPNAFRYLEVK